MNKRLLSILLVCAAIPMINTPAVCAAENTGSKAERTILLYGSVSVTGGSIWTVKGSCRPDGRRSTASGTILTRKESCRPDGR